MDKSYRTYDKCFDTKENKAVKYYHIAFSTPFGPGTYFYRGESHPFMPKEYDERTEKIASNLSIQYAKNISPTAIIYTSVIELPLEVAKARWPEDFLNDTGL
jgi:hypothetical protein